MEGEWTGLEQRGRVSYQVRRGHIQEGGDEYPRVAQLSTAGGSRS